MARFNKNKQAIELFNDIRDAGRPATREEQEILAGYTGWGSFGQELFQGNWENPQPKKGWEERDAWLRDQLGKDEWEGMQRSITNAHYTDPPTVLAMWDMMRRMGFDGGRVLEPSMGIGNFFGMMPLELKGRSQLAGIELDPVTGGMAKLIYPDAHINVMGYQDSKTPDNFYDVVIGNWPFEDTVIADRRYNRLNPYLHDYFFLKAVDQVRPGGIVMGITSKGTMDKMSGTIRTALAKKAELVAAFRLPSGAFEEYAGTKVVTDIIILRKRAEAKELVADEGWIKSVPYQTPQGESVNLNEYYVAHPDHVIGRIEYGHGTTFNRAGMIVTRPDNMMEQLQRIVSMVPEAAYQPDTRGEQVSYIANHTADREGALIRQDGEFYIVRGEHLAPAAEVAKYELKDPKKTADREAQFDKLIDMRRTYGELIEAERGTRDADPEPIRKKLREQYQAFTKAHGTLNKSYGLNYLRKIDDPFYPALAALENREGDSYRPATILERSTIRAPKRIENPSIADAFVLARNQSIDPSLEDIATIAGKPAAEVKAELIAKGAIFELPNGDITPSDLYLSGNVREKLRQAEAALEQGNTAMERNVEALREVLPADVPYFRIEVQLGAPWVPQSTYADYIAHMLGLDSASGIEVTYRAGRWKAKIPSRLLSRPEASTGFGTAEYKFSKLVNAALSNQNVTIRRRDSEGGEYVDFEATQEVNAKISEIRRRFGEWLWSDPERRADLEREYNEARNAYAEPKFDGSFLSFEGMALSLGSGPFDLRQHQADAIWRALVTRRSLNAHEVGTGKTFTMGGIAVESRRYGIARKPMILAHNANSKSVAAEIQQMYPAAKVLYIDNLSRNQIATRLRQIANDDWDAIVVPHSLISNFAFREDTLMQMAQEEISALEEEALEAAQEDGAGLSIEDMDDEDKVKKLRSPTAKELVKQRNRIIETIKKQAQRASKEGAIPFEDLGIDMLLVDEAHEFKKPPISTRMRMKGLNTGTSDRSIALYYMARYVRAHNNGGNIHLFTGTPITNTLTEIYHHMRYIMGEEMADAGVDYWDGWFGSFASEVMDVELNAAGEYESVTRLAGFINVPELRRMIGQYMDVVFADDMPEMQPRQTRSGKTLHSKDLTEGERNELLNGRTEDAKDRPYKKVVNETADLTPEQAEAFRQIQSHAARWRQMSGKERKEAMLSGAPESPIIYENMAAKASFDVRLMRGEELAGMEGQVPDDPNSKASRVIRNVLDIYNSDPRATQVIFTQQGLGKVATRSVGPVGEKRQERYKVFSTVYDMVERMVQQGIPREQIAVVDGSTSKDKRKEIADKMNRSEIRVVIGSTQSLGVGVNMQRNLRAMHHMDAPWMPGDLEQRNGRGHRQGNQWNTVLEFRYLTDRIDGRRWQVLAIKQRFINAFLKADDSQRVIEGDAAAEEETDILQSFAEAAGDPRILIRTKLQKKLDQMRQRERLHGQGVADARRMARRLEEERRLLINEVARIERGGIETKVADAIQQNAGANFTVTIEGQRYTERKTAQDALDKLISKGVREGSTDVPVGVYAGHQLLVTWPRHHVAPHMEVDIDGERISGNRASFLSLESALRGFNSGVDGMRSQIEQKATSIERANRVSEEPFQQADQLRHLEQQLEDLEADLQANPVAPPAWLRVGAPLESIVHWNGKPFEVTGHRWTDEGWFVLAQDESGQVAIPYMEAMDDQGMPLYDEREFQAPEVVSSAPAAGEVEAEDPGPVVFSRSSTVYGDSPSGGMSVEEVQRIADEFLARYNGNIPLQAFVRTTQEDIYGPDATPEQYGVIKGAYHARRGVFTLAADNLSDRRDVERTLRHEIIGHYGLNTFKAEDKRAILEAILGSRQEPSLREVWARIDRDYHDQNDLVRAEEVFASLAEQDTSKFGAWWNRVIALLNKALRAVGLSKGLTTREELLSLADRIARQIRDGRREQQTFPSDDQSQFARTAYGVEEVDAADLRRQGAQSPFFKRWFGQSKIVDGNGAPLVLYHSTDADFTVFDRSRVGQSTGHASAGLGFFLNPNRSASSRYGQNVMAVYARIENPYRMGLEEFAGFNSVAEAVKRREELQALGYDGIQVPMDGTVIAFEPGQLKSATDNVGTFNLNDDDIRFSKAAPTDSAAFKNWFGDSKVVDESGEPLRVYHGTQSRPFTVFRPSGEENMFGTGEQYHFTDNQSEAYGYSVGNYETASKGRAGTGRVVEAYLKMENPADLRHDSWNVDDVDVQGMMEDLNTDGLLDALKQAGYDGIIHDGDLFPGNVTGTHYVVFEPSQIKSATDNVGTFDPNDPDIRFRRSAVRGLADSAITELNKTFSVPGKLNWWHKTVGTMYNLAQRSPAFKPVFESAQKFVDDVAHYAADSAELAPKLLPRLETLRDLARRPITSKDNKAIAKPIFEGTLLWTRDDQGKPKRVEGDEDAGIVWTDDELRSMFKLNPEQIAMYREFREATDRSLDTMGRADMLRYGGQDVKGLQDAVMDADDIGAAASLLVDHLENLSESYPEREQELQELADGIGERLFKIKRLQKQGYAPLSRFGRYTVDVVVKGERQYFGLFETKREANNMAAQMRQEFGVGSVRQGTLSNEAFKLFAGITPESLELFGNMLGLDSTGGDARDQAFQEYLRLTKTNRSAMRRLIHRKGVAGYSEDVGRVLASFIYSNARQTAAGLNLGDLGEAVNAIPKEQGELKDAAVRLSEYIKNPQEEAQAVRGLLFAQYLGGSVASAFVNMTQPIAVSFPWLSQFGGARRAAAELGRAARQMSTKGFKYEADLASALKEAEDDGTVSPQEVHQLMAQARGSGSLRAGDGTRAGEARAAVSNAVSRLSIAWGKMFGAAEEINRRMTFIAAYRMAKQAGMTDPAGFARHAVRETQFVYSKANKMQWGRGAIGGTLMTFKTYSVAYVELMHRLWNQGAPGSRERAEGRKAAMLMVGVLMLVGGVGGLPFAEDLEDVVDGAAQLMGYNFSSRKAKEEFLQSLFGDAGALFVEKGISGLPGAPMDVSGRLGMGNLIPGTGMFQERTSHTRDMLELLGPGGDFANRIVTGGRRILKGDVGAGLLEVSPVAVRNVAKGVDMTRTGMYRDAKGYKVLETNHLDAALKAMGFQPNAVAEVQESNWLNQRAKNFYNMRAQEIRAMWAAGIFEKDDSKVRRAREAIADWNQKNPQQPMIIRVPDVMRRAREMAKSKDQRIADTAPRAMRAQLQRELMESR